MSKRKNLNDFIHGDRAVVRQNKTSLGGYLDHEWSDKKWSSWGSSTVGSYERCYHSHPALKLPSTELVIYGGSCSDPKVCDADVYIGFDLSMSFTERHWPWKKGHEVLFRIKDMCAPDKPDEFRKLVDWTRKQLEAGLKVHCGCIGGHGRTGTFLAALVSTFGEKDAITYVRQHYCKKAVESSAQIEFLGKHFDIKSAKPSKSYASKSYSSKSYSSKSYASSTLSSGVPSSGPVTQVRVYRPMLMVDSIWGKSN